MGVPSTTTDHFSPPLPPPPQGLDALAPPGSPAFVPSVIDRIHHLLPAFPIDRVVLQSILLCVLAGNRSLILRTKDDDVSLVQNIAVLLLSTVFGYTTHKHRVTPSTTRTPSSFITSLFLTSRRERSSTHKQRRPTTRRSRTFPAAPQKPYDAAPPDTDTDSTPLPPSSTAVPHSPRWYSDSLTPLVADGSSVVSLRSTTDLARALVVSGLEHANAPCQRALLEVFQSRTIAPELAEGSAGTVNSSSAAGWRLPDDFICVYVCPFDPYERPRIHRNLVDKFALSATVALSASTRQAYSSYLASHPSASLITPTPTTPLSPLLPAPTILLVSTSTSPLTPAAEYTTPTVPIFPPHFLPRLRALSTPTHTHADARLALFTSRLFSAARHHPELDASLLTARAVRDVDALARAHCVLGGAELGAELIAQAAWDDVEGDDAEGEGDDAETESVLGDGARQVRVHLHAVDGASTLSGARSSAKEGASVHVAIQSDDDDRDDHTDGTSRDDSEPAWMRGELEPGVVLDLSEADVGKIVPRVLSHRLRVRDGPEDEVLASLVYPACGRAVKTRQADGEEEEGVWQRQPIKDILIQLFKEI